MILREILPSRKIGLKHVVLQDGEEVTAIKKWYGGHPVFPYLGEAIYRDKSGLMTNSADLSGEKGIIGDNAGQLTAVYGGEYDFRDFLYFGAPAVTVGASNYVDEGALVHKPIGITFHSDAVRPTEIGIPDGTDFVTVLLFPCMVTLSVDEYEKTNFTSLFANDATSSDIYVTVEYDNGINVFKYKFSNSTVGAIGAVLAANTTQSIYTIEFWG